MTAPALIVPGVVQNGMVVPERPGDLPEGARVSIVLPAERIPAELLSEFAAWERASDEAWNMIDEWEKEQPP